MPQNALTLWIEFTKGGNSMVQVKSRPGEPAAVLMKRFKKACETAKLKDAMKRAAHYEKPSDKNRRKRGQQARRAMAAARG
jgi:ribosomal protein S21